MGEYAHERVGNAALCRGGGSGGERGESAVARAREAGPHRGA